MKSFRTNFPELKLGLSISHTDSILCMGSCFAEKIFHKLNFFQFDALESPFGISFNPIVLANQLDKIIENKRYSEHDLYFHDELYHSFDHHSNFSHTDANICINKINEYISQAHTFFIKSNYLIITFGSAHFYRLKSSKDIVSNCHKVPQNEFIKSMSTTQEIVDTWSKTIEKLKDSLPNIKIIFSISPVRYLRDGFIENNRSKASLILAIASLTEMFQHAHYFPAYEIFMDDLRDYRFTKNDRVHPSDEAFDYIWDYFEDGFLLNETMTINSEIESLQLQIGHRPIHPESPSHIELLKKIEIEKKILALNFPQVKFNWF